MRYDKSKFTKYLLNTLLTILIITLSNGCSKNRVPRTTNWKSNKKVVLRTFHHSMSKIVLPKQIIDISNPDSSSNLGKSRSGLEIFTKRVKPQKLRLISKRLNVKTKEQKFVPKKNLECTKDKDYQPKVGMPRWLFKTLVILVFILIIVAILTSLLLLANPFGLVLFNWGWKILTGIILSSLILAFVGLLLTDDQWGF